MTFVLQNKAIDIMSPKDKESSTYLSSMKVDVFRAELPDQEVDPELFDVVKTHMVQGMKSGICSKRFPKSFTTDTLTVRVMGADSEHLRGVRASTSGHGLGRTAAPSRERHIFLCHIYPTPYRVQAPVLISADTYVQSNQSARVSREKKLCDIYQVPSTDVRLGEIQLDPPPLQAPNGCSLTHPAREFILLSQRLEYLSLSQSSDDKQRPYAKSQVCAVLVRRLPPCAETSAAAPFSRPRSVEQR
ncbi:hypothetical protein EVAR_40805_1 [Eumeta japonica]|uniref:Uncharacterized protein n=1 Tax=Eumeta variegata TaxID=151549 RepID=A0A4C1X6S5_EUMVA|nr:hypothetical protein EVAR_40805_1 [Eumeta japonica]